MHPNGSFSFLSAAVQTMSEVLVKNLSKLTLDPSIKLPSPLPEYPPQQQEREKKPQGLVDRILSNNRKRSGVRTLLTARKERMERMIPLIQYQRYLNKRSMVGSSDLDSVSPWGRGWGSGGAQAIKNDEQQSLNYPGERRV